jgi:membrane-bound lytic murein transglycosylase D
MPVPKALKVSAPKLPASNTRESPSPLIFDIPVTYNPQVSRWIKYYQTSGQPMFKRWLERSYKYFPMIKRELERNRLPKDLAYMVMIESGFAPHATSHADAVGPWQFIEPTANRYGLRTNWWLDERRDFRKSTLAAIRYMSDLYNEFESWYLVAASYNMGENGLRRIIQKHRTRDYWKLIELKALPAETSEYVPKLLAAMLVAKAPSLYGFRSLKVLEPIEYQVINAPGGTKLDDLADYLGVTRQALREINTELKVGFVPKEANSHPIHIPHGALRLAKQFIAQNIKDVAME